MANYTFQIRWGSEWQTKGNISATFVPATSESPAKLTGFSYKNTHDHESLRQHHDDIVLDYLNQHGWYVVEKHLNHDFTVTGHGPHRVLSFLFKPDEIQAFMEGHLADPPQHLRSAPFEWTATQDTRRQEKE